MVRPVNSKRKLFNTSKEQSKENEPDQINSSDPTGFPLRGAPLSQSSYQSHKSLILNRREHHNHLEELKAVNCSRKCEIEDVGPTLTPGRTAMPMSERQQIALLLQMSSPSPNNKSALPLSSPCTPGTPHYGRGISKRNERGETPLHLAAIKGDVQKVAQLIAQGANVNATDYAGWTALHEACNKGFIVIASLLIKAGADVNAKGLDNDTPLHDACVNNHPKIVRLLLTSGGKSDSLNQKGKSPRDVCRSPKILKLIEQSDAGILEVLETPRLESNYNFSSSVPPVDSCYYSASPLSAMSRRTPPNSKAEDKPSAPTPSAPTSTAPQAPTSTSSGVSLRLPGGVQRTPDKTKSSGDTEDVYEFRCSKEESKDDKSESPDGATATSSEAKNDKRPRENEEEEEEAKKKRRREDNCSSSKPPNRTNSSRPCQDKTSKTTSRSGNGSSNKPPSMTSVPPTGSSSSSGAGQSNANAPMSVSGSATASAASGGAAVTEQKKSPTGSAANSPKPNKGGDSDSEDPKSEAPKVPPLKIVLAPGGLGEQETSAQSGKNGNNRQLPYVVNSAEDKEQQDGKDVASIKEEPSSPSSSTTAVPSTTNSTSTCGTNCTPSSGAVIITATTVTTSSISVTTNNSSITSSSSNANNTISCSSSIATSTATTSSSSSSNVVSSSTSSSNEKTSSGTRITRSQRGGGGSDDGAPEPKAMKCEVKQEEAAPSSATEVIHPRKRKLKMKEPEAEPSSGLPPSEQPVTNCYEMFLKIRKQVDRRRKLLFPVQPKPPQGFKDYLMNRCSYVLANSNNQSIPIVAAPSNLQPLIEELFNEQEQERHKLKVQQMIEKEKLVLSVEQEILRVHGRAARALANQVLPFSVCTILKDEEVYNVISAEQEEKDRNARSRYNGRLFLSWLQDVDDKWEKIKEAMVLRHHNEAESLHAVQKMDWEWKQKELGLVEPSAKPPIDEQHVPMVQVADFDLLQPNNAC